MQEYYSIITKYGSQKEIACLAGSGGFDIEEIAVGDGNGSLYEPDEEQAALKNEVWRAKIDKIDTETDKDGNKTLFAVVHIPASAGGFTIREAGVFDKSGGLVIVAKMPETAKRLPDTGDIKQLSIRIDLSVINEVVLPFLIDPSINTATVEYCDKHYQNLNEKGEPDGYAPLDSEGLVPVEHIPKIGNTGFSLFDLVMKDHILTFEDEDSKYLAPLGSYVYKDAAPGRHGYGDFYNRVVEEYNNESNTLVAFKNNVAPVGALTISNGVLSGFSAGSYAKLPQVFNPSSSTWELVIAFSANSLATEQAIFMSCVEGQAANRYLLLEIEAGTGQMRCFYNYGSSSWETGGLFGENGKISPGVKYWAKVVYDGTNLKGYLSTDGSDYTLCLNEERAVPATAATNNITALGIYCANEKLMPLNGSIDLKESYIKINGEMWWSGAVVLSKNANGHCFYDIADKAAVDGYYEAHGMAYMFGVDTENERIFLPRNDWFFQSGSAADVDSMVEAGLPNITGTVKTQGIGGQENSGALWSDGNTAQNAYATGADARATQKVFFDASRCSSVYGASDTVQPKAVKVCYYMVVANAQVSEAVANVTQISTSENDTLPLFHYIRSSEDMTATGAYVDASLGAYFSGVGLYESAYNELVNRLTAGDSGVKEHGDASITDYDFVVNQESMTFRLPLVVRGERVLVAKKVATAEDSAWYNLYSDGWCEQGGVATSSSIIFSRAFSDTNYNVGGLELTGTLDGSPYVYAKTTSGMTISQKDYNQDGLLWFHNMYWSACGYTAIPRLSEYTEGNRLYFKVCNALSNLDVLDCAGVMGALNGKIGRVECPAYVVETYRNGASWYRVWSDGVIEQGGMGVTNTAALAEISLMKPYSAADYSILLQARGGTTSLTGWTVNQYDSVAGWKIDKFSVYAAINMSALTGQVASFFWYTIGK